MKEIVGLIGSICFAISAWPQAWLSYKTKSAKGVKWSFILLWLSGSVFSTFYAIYTGQFVLLPNYVSGGLGITIVLVIKMMERNRDLTDRGER